MSITLAFDIYGTLIDTQDVTQKLSEYTSLSTEFSRLWREKQLEYSFRRGLMRRYENFAVCTRNALDYTDAVLKTSLDESAKQALMDSYRVLPAFADVEENLIIAKEADFSLYAFSNGGAEAVETLLETAAIRNYFDGVVSVEKVKTFKPNPDVYCMFMETTSSCAENTWLISSNPFDVMGAVSAGMKAAWLKRSADAIFDPWGIEPTHTIDSLSRLPELAAL